MLLLLVARIAGVFVVRFVVHIAAGTVVVMAPGTVAAGTVVVEQAAGTGFVLQRNNTAAALQAAVGDYCLQ